MQIDQLEPIGAVGAQGGQQAGGGALRGRSGIVEFMRQVAGQLPQSRELLRLLLNASDLAHAVEQSGDHALRHGGDGRQHLRKKRAVNQQDPHRGNGESLAAVALHARKRQKAGHLSGAADEKRHRAAVLAAHMNLAFEDEHHVLGRSTLLKQNVTGAGHKLLAMAGEPEAILGRQAV